MSYGNSKVPAEQTQMARISLKKAESHSEVTVQNLCSVRQKQKRSGNIPSADNIFHAQKTLMGRYDLVLLKNNAICASL